MRKHQNVNQEKTYYKIHFNQNYSLQNVKSKHNKRAKETQKMYKKKKDRENARFYKRNRNACMGVYVKIIYSQKEIHLQEEFLRRQGNYLKHRHGKTVNICTIEQETEM